MDDDAPELLDSRQPVGEHFRIATRIKNNPDKPGESHDRQETSDGEKPDRKTDGSYRLIAGHVLLGWQSFPFSLMSLFENCSSGRESAQISRRMEPTHVGCYGVFDKASQSCQTVNLMSSVSCGARGALIDRHALFPKEGGVTFIIQHLAHFAGKHCGRVSFGQELNSGLKHAMLSNGVIRVTRCEEDFEIGISCFQPFRHYFAAHQRHDDI